ncbi:pimeloyl-ACP methyl ester carboxylesterase [Nocardioides albertanoniae]|uniref:Pimeloyl-ACP methyl ester carboxylesterase n=1 Tax=Nocardioides albertanoniae TaxID=1175486 RepID=A0A543A0R8_9ACTN|nr:alpha/beta hydrolase [Nocardioides albertanoniae]TQL66189.1 pimeloyl-ACP methyl ester carboxylesterase [Nocardioides albertanoniae]
MDLGSHNIGGPRDVGHFRDQESFARFAEAYSAAFEKMPPMRVQDVETSYGRLRAYWFGDADDVPIVLLPGSGAATPMWWDHLHDLAGLGHPVVAVEPIGQAGASRQTAPIKHADHATRWFTEALEALAPEGAHVIGASLGGWLGLQTAVRSPERFRSLTVIDPPSVFARLSPTFLALGIGSSIRFLPSSVRRWMFDTIIGLGPSDADDPDAVLAMAAFDTFGLRLPPPSGLTDDDLAGVAVPVLALIGGRSRVHAPDKAAQRARLMPGATVEVWATAGHVLNAAYPIRFAAAVGKHITGRRPPAASSR